jgi:putative transposase
MNRSTLRRKSRRDPQEASRKRLREPASVRVRYGYRPLTVLLKREGWKVNAKRIHRLSTEERSERAYETAQETGQEESCGRAIGHRAESTLEHGFGRPRADAKLQKCFGAL